MTPAPDRSWLDLLRTQAERFAQVVEHGDPAREVISCPGWTLRDLTDHLGGVHQWAAHAVVEGDPSLEPEPAPPAGAAGLAAWYRRYATTLVDVLTARPAEAPAWTLDRDDRTAGFWRRRQVHEVTMHLWDAEHALGMAQPIEPALAGTAWRRSSTSCTRVRYGWGVRQLGRPPSGSRHRTSTRAS
ncbi:maleylpyruvate isomerase family mycothiol-dependent enzyme [Nocardioides sp. S5]|uniref:maleylpyruvate isomerase family mycothiol-dependent enzyme n=1 Tax=Nocardioides sp. S5 TaxID=2017486 RepID=UPI001A8CA1F4|nr:maleylpyruvate isomerase family mycothiol-dependent enzyme [Nocardioides sp. S5]